MRHNLSDCTFLIPVRLDSIDRLVNLKATLGLLIENFKTNIHILEADSFNTGLISSCLPDAVKYSFIIDYDPIFFRTFYINKMVKECQTPFLSVWDTDIIAPPLQIVRTLELLRTKEADFVYPYEKKFLETSKIIRELYLKNKEIDILERHQQKMKHLYPPNPVGGAFFANRKIYIESGIENLKYYGWGVEDGERIARWKGLGYKCKRVPGNLYHLTHSRGLNSNFQSGNHRNTKICELNRISSLTRYELKEEIEKWNGL
jgi:hypothetical protein